MAWLIFFTVFITFAIPMIIMYLEGLHEVKLQNKTTNKNGK